MRADVEFDSLFFGVELLEHEGIWRSRIHCWDQLDFVVPEHDGGECGTGTKGLGDIGGHDQLRSKLEKNHVDRFLRELQCIQGRNH